MAAFDESISAPGAASVRRAGAPGRASSAPARRSEPVPWLKQGIFIGSLAPLASIVLRAFTGQLDANPIAQVENELGLTALIFLVATLVCTPARKLFGWTWAVRVRRELGLFAFFYAVLHFLAYIGPDEWLDLPTILEDIDERPFITVGFLALVLMVPLAVTSSGEWVRTLGFKRWQQLHYLTYAAGILAVIHFVWRVKIDVSQPVMYAIVLGGLLAVRVAFWLRQRSEAAAKPSPRTRRSVD
jgi:sulfoxide reductase heme-binding subunit YedZ